MKAALRGLTSRGRALVAAGTTAVVLALLFGQQDVLRVGILAAALPLLAAASVTRTRFRLACRRSVEPARICIGETSTVSLSLENVAALPTGLLLIEDNVPTELGVRPRFVVDRLAPRSSRKVQFAVRSDVRGKFVLGPMSVRLTDPFGFCRVDRSFSAQHHLLVTPQVELLPSLALKGDWTGSGDSRSRSVASAGEDDVAVREYRHGDELRRVHWRATAKKGALMVRREEQPWESRCTLLLDTRHAAHHGEGSSASFERAVSATASICTHLSRRGYAVRLAVGSGANVTGGPEADLTGAGADPEGLLLDALAVVSTARQSSIGALASVLRHASEGLLVTVLGEVTTSDADRLVRARHGMGTSVALLTDVAGWLPDGSPRRDAAVAQLRDVSMLLRAAGWIVAPLCYGTSVSETWRHLAFGVDSPTELSLSSTGLSA